MSDFSPKLWKPTANTTQRYNFYSTEIDFEDAKGAAYATHAFAGRKKMQ